MRKNLLAGLALILLGFLAAYAVSYNNLTDKHPQSRDFTRYSAASFEKACVSKLLEVNTIPEDFRQTWITKAARPHCQCRQAAIQAAAGGRSYGNQTIEQTLRNLGYAAFFLLPANGLPDDHFRREIRYFIDISPIDADDAEGFSALLREFEKDCILQLPASG